jgi:hypothetical protein
MLSCHKEVKVQVSLYVKGFGAAAVRESNQGCNEELCLLFNF